MPRDLTLRYKPDVVIRAVPDVVVRADGSAAILVEMLDEHQIVVALDEAHIVDIEDLGRPLLPFVPPATDGLDFTIAGNSQYLPILGLLGA